MFEPCDLPFDEAPGSLFDSFTPTPPSNNIFTVITLDQQTFSVIDTEYRSAPWFGNPFTDQHFPSDANGVGQTLQIYAIIDASLSGGIEYQEAVYKDQAFQPGWSGSVTTVNDGQELQFTATRDWNWTVPNPASPSQTGLTQLCYPSWEVAFTMEETDPEGWNGLPWGLWRYQFETISNFSATASSDYFVSQDAWDTSNLDGGLDFPTLTFDLRTNAEEGITFMDTGTLEMSLDVVMTPGPTVYTETVISGGSFASGWSGSITQTDEVTYRIVANRDDVWTVGNPTYGEPLELTDGAQLMPFQLVPTIEITDTSPIPHTHVFGEELGPWNTEVCPWYLPDLKPWSVFIQVPVINVTGSPPNGEPGVPFDPAEFANISISPPGGSPSVRERYQRYIDPDTINMTLWIEGDDGNVYEEPLVINGVVASPWSGSLIVDPFDSYAYFIDTALRSNPWNVGVGLQPTPLAASEGFVGITTEVTSLFGFKFRKGTKINDIGDYTNAIDGNEWKFQLEESEEPANKTVQLNPNRGIASSQALGVHTITQAEAPPEVPPTEPFADITPSQDTIRGGALLTVHGNVNLVDTAWDRDFKVQGVPMGWYNDVGTAIGSMQGLTMRTSASLGPSVVYFDTDVSFAVTVEWESLGPRGRTTVSTPLLELTFELPDEDRVGVRISRIENNYITESFVGDLVGGYQVVSSANPNLTLVRYGRFVFMLVDNIETFAYRRFTESTDIGNITLTVPEPANSIVESRIKLVTIRSHALIGENLLVNKTDLSRTRMVGNAPASSTVYGPVDVTIFGPWGSSHYSASTDPHFSYVFPQAQQISGSSLFTYSDPIVHN